MPPNDGNSSVVWLVIRRAQKRKLNLEKRLKIAINVRTLLPGRLEGVGKFSHEVLRRLTLAHPEVDFYLFFDRKFDPQFIYGPNVHGISVFPQARHPFLWWLWFHLSVPFHIRRIQPDLVISTDGFLPKTKVPTLNVIHDLNFVHRPKDMPNLAGAYWRHFIRKYVPLSTRIATVSHFSKKDLAETYGYPEAKIDVVYNAAGKEFHPLEEARKTETRLKYSEGQPYFVYVGAINPRKNLETIFRAFDQFKDRDQHDYKMLVVGSEMFLTSEMKQALRDMKNRSSLVFTGRLSVGELPAVVASAHALCLVSHLEGFGIPVLEAMQCGIPVMASNVTSLPEVGGEAALYVSPTDVNAMASALEILANDGEMWQRLSEAGLARAENFSWDASAEKFWEIIQKTLKK